MASKKKNANYVTEKTQNKKAEAARKKKAEATKLNLLLIGIPVLILVAIILTIVLVGAAQGWYDEKPVATKDVLITLSTGESIHIELYGEVAPKTVEAFLNHISSKRYNGVALASLIDGALGTTEISSTKKIDGEFAANGVENNIKHRAGVLSMVRSDDDYNSANGQFVIMTKRDKSRDGNYAAFGKVTEGMDVIKALLKEAEIGEDGKFVEGDRPVIVSVEVHAPH